MRLLAAAFVAVTLATPHVPADSPMTKAAKAFVATLDQDQKSKTVFAADSPDRSTWGYVPGPRIGLSWKEMTETEKEAAVELLKVSLSQEGYKTVEAIRGLEPVLAEIEHGNTGRDPGKYWFQFYGSPDSESPWVWRYEGHHVSLTFANKGGVLVSSTPQFLGSSPAEVKSGPLVGQRILAKQQDLGFRLVESLSDDQKKKAVLADVAPADIVTSNTRKASIEGHQGIPYADLTPEQQSTLRSLIVTHAVVQSDAERERRIAMIEKEGYENVVFAWTGPIKRASRHYYRVQGLSFVIEYDNTQDDGNHIHAVWREFKGEFGEDLLAEHYARDHKGEGSQK